MLQVKRAILAAVILAAGVGQAHGFNFGQTTANPPTGTQVLCQSAAPVSVGGTLAETALATCQLPALGPNDALRVNYVISYTGNTNTKTLRPKIAGTALYSAARSTSGWVLDNVLMHITNRGVTNSQVMDTNAGTGQTAAPITAAVETSAPTTFSLTGQTTLETGFTPTAANVSGTGTTVTVIQTTHGLNTGEYIQAAGSTTSGYNVDPVQITRIDANTFTYPGTGTGTPATAPTIKRYSVIKLESYTVELLPGR